jgi:hypothetical protein
MGTNMGGLYDCIRNLIADFIGVPFTDRFYTRQSHSSGSIGEGFTRSEQKRFSSGNHIAKPNEKDPSNKNGE